MIYFLICFLGFLLIGVVYYSRQIVFPKIYGHDETFKYENDNATYDQKIFTMYKMEKFELSSNYGYELRGELFLQNSHEKFIILCHGITSNYTGMKKYCGIFLDLGFSILLYDHRNHGYSDSINTSMGFFEKSDAKQCVDYIIKRFEPHTIGIMGESMGASTALQLAAIDHRLSFCIEDSGYSNAYDLFKYRSQKDHNKILSLLTYPTSLYLKLFYKWNFKDISVIHSINNIQCPVLFIHGEADDYVPYRMVHEMYSTFNGSKMLYTVENADHVMSIRVDKEGYKRAVNNFIKKYVN